MNTNDFNNTAIVDSNSSPARRRNTLADKNITGTDIAGTTAGRRRGFLGALRTS